jgi:hypothetical protein
MMCKQELCNPISKGPVLNRCLLFDWAWLTA